MRAPLVPIEAIDPMDLLHLDFTKIEVSGDHEKELKRKPEIVNVLVVTDHFTRHTMAFVTEDTTAHTVAHILYHHYFYIYTLLVKARTLSVIRCSGVPKTINDRLMLSFIM